ncbi:MAG: TfoX/Sxy family protein [Deltaproteobacteria bacterium]|nr:TfoX/Sxy family protein [Deltaproteobacteria bacterium]
MGWATPPPALVARFARLLPADPRVERRQMFGCPCAFADGRMFAGLFRDRLFVRLPEAMRGKLMALAGAGPFEPRPGQVMREYVCVPAAHRRVREWLAASAEYTAGLPARPARRRRRTRRRR